MLYKKTQENWKILEVSLNDCTLHKSHRDIITGKWTSCKETCFFQFRKGEFIISRQPRDPRTILGPLDLHNKAGNLEQ